MNLSIRAINEFKEVYFKRIGIILTDQEANDLGLELLNYFKLFYRPIPKKHAWVTEPIVPVYEIK